MDTVFDVQIDGNRIRAQHLAGKSAPDTFLMAAKLLGIEPAGAVVIEDAISESRLGLTGTSDL